MQCRGRRERERVSIVHSTYRVISSLAEEVLEVMLDLGSSWHPGTRQCYPDACVSAPAWGGGGGGGGARSRGCSLSGPGPLLRSPPVTR